jgi:hypothetical protein
MRFDVLSKTSFLSLFFLEQPTTKKAAKKQPKSSQKAAKKATKTAPHTKSKIFRSTKE